MTNRDKDRLIGIKPELVSVLNAVFSEMEANTTPMFVVIGVRTTKQQADAHAKGRTVEGENVTPSHPLGDIVTNCDGVKFRSPHQVHSDGFGYAVDCAFIDAKPFASTHPWEKYGEALEARGVTWGGRFHHPVDLDHAELKG